MEKEKKKKYVKGFVISVDNNGNIKCNLVLVKNPKMLGSRP